ncbi:histidinol dehydrogenase [Sporolactobacillus terrae]|uniref:Histidinol dehydrogenase n=1 Tax=Sporolactobacillus terrae TaxID=269673 RepID=A0A410DA80_9BACL|nr:histidinol dehydrogenase [Sporolactobacillus terrae]QAA23032.1 histidinol dehydrogenase [Sporolactobacillus terrae]QAA26005.1 histidinol dehydrogenase [Sporolactobacillus terrae]UAK15099.1 histidinol dehydrogenase [Sporolactobacillus terrae]BBN99442.1 histidinol dehydrogenase [Sporolactobacillus terrae]
MEWIKDGNLDFLKKRKVEAREDAQKSVAEIMNRVKSGGDEALKAFTKQFDGIALEAIQVTEDQMTAAAARVPKPVLQAIKQAARNIRAFHEKQIPQSWTETVDQGVVLGQKVTPLDSVGVYVPGGTACYPSSVLMGAIPALVAGVKRVVLVSPPQKNGLIADGVLAAAHEIGIHEIYQVGGAQAIAALAYGTESIRSVNKIVGPGNLYVMLAKKYVFGDVAIDSLAGPSEIAVVADDSANPSWVAADLLSQAEHDRLSMPVLVTDSEPFGRQVEQEVEKQLKELPREAIASESANKQGKIILTANLQQAADVINQIAPEHLELATREPKEVLKFVRNAGAIFLGKYSSEPVGDYFAGPNHIIPTNGSARYASPLGVESFIKRSSIIEYSDEALQANGQAIAAFARFEGLEGHARAVEKRMKGAVIHE